MRSTPSEPPREEAAPATEQELDLEGLERLLEDGERVDAIVEGVARVRIDGYAPFISAAIHDGHRLREDLISRCRLDDGERLAEEDPHTGDLIGAMSISVTALDSRYEYDLNRPPAQCVHTEAWGKDVWSRKLPQGEVRRSRSRHRAFYGVLDAIVGRLEDIFGACVIFDIHSYNHQRKGPAPPLFNIGTAQVDMSRWGAVIRNLEQSLARIELPNLTTRVALDEVFQGRGYLAAHANARYENTLVIPLEIAKVFMDAETQEPFPLVIEQLQQQLTRSLGAAAAFFSRRHTRKKIKRLDLLPDSGDPSLAQVDARLHQLARNIDTLAYVNPINIATEKKRFLSRHGQEEPSFRYRQLDIDTYAFRETLYHLPVKRIRDPDIRALYRDVIDMLATRVELISTVGTKEFLYNSLRYYGEPTEMDLANARFLLHAASIPDGDDAPEIEPAAAKEFFEEKARQWDIPVKVELSGRLAAKAMAMASRRSLLVNRNERFSRTDLLALSHHEIGVHHVTTLNSRAQALKVLSIGLPGNTAAQEGLAVMCEYLSGNMNSRRLRAIAHRVVAVDQMVRKNDFRQTYHHLRGEHGLEADAAFSVTVRAHRAGGFTKDYLYLRGLQRALELHRGGGVDNLLLGKVGFKHEEVLGELVARGILAPPRLVPPALRDPASTDPLIDYVISSIR